MKKENEPLREIGKGFINLGYKLIKKGTP
jgi:hypothetical protein